MKPSANAVADRYLEAGVFEAPSELLKSYLRWALPVYAGHVLVRAETLVAQMRDREKPWLDAIRDVERVKRSYASDIRGLREGETIIWDVWWRKGGLPIPYKVGVKRGEGSRSDFVLRVPEHDLYYFNTSEKRMSFHGKKVHYTRNTIEKITARVGSVFDNILQDLNRRLEMARVHKGKDDDIQLVEATLLAREAKKYAQSPKSYKSQAKTRIPIDVSVLKGWRYWDRILEANGGDEGRIARTLAEQKWQGVDVALVFQGHKSRGGVWFEGKRLLEVDVPYWGQPNNVESFKNGIEEIGRIARHEFQHVGQSLLKVLTGQSEILGLPSPSIRDTARDPLGFPKTPSGTRFDPRLRGPHALQDVEFYTRLADEIVAFQRHSRHIPIHLRREAVAHYTAAKSGMFRYDNQEKGQTITRRIGPAPFFESLKRDQPDKWRKAVAEFVKGIQQKGVRMAAGPHQV